MESPSTAKQRPPADHDGVLTAKYLSSSTESNLLSRLVTISSTLEALPTASGVHIDKAFIDELSAKMYLAHPSADVQIIAATNLAEVARVAATSTTAAAAALALPLKPSAITEVVKLWINTVNRLRSNKSTTVAEYIRHLVEVLASSHAFAGLLPKASGIADDSITAMIDAALSFIPHDADDTYVSSVAVLVADCVAASGSVTDAQMQLLMLAIAQRVANPNAYRAVLAVLRRHDDILQGALSDFVMAAFTDAVESLHLMDVEGDAEPLARRNAVTRVTAVAGLIGECAKASIHLVQQLLPAAVKLLDSIEGNDARVALVGGVGQAFLAVPALVQEYLGQYLKLVATINDARPAVRLQALRFATDMLLGNIGNEVFWGQLAPVINAKVVDHDETVRRVALTSVAALADQALARLPQSILDNVGSRCIDRRPALRAQAITMLATLYRSSRHATPDGVKLAFIPKAILQSVHIDGNLPYVEAAVAELLPNPARTAAAAAAGDKPSGGKAGGKLLGSAKVPTVAVFDFEIAAQGTGAAAAAARVTFARAFVAMCEDILRWGSDVANGCFDTLWTLLEKRTQLRRATARLMELRAEVKRAGGAGEPVAEKASQIQRLIEFLGLRTHAKATEWGDLFKMKDEKAVKALIHLSSADCDDLGAGAAEASARVKGCVSKEVANFFDKQVLPRLAFPVSAAHVDEVVKMIAAARDSDESNQLMLSAARALSLLAQAAPHLVARRMADVVAFVVQDSKSNTKDTQDEALILLLRVLTQSVALQGSAQLPAAVSAKSTQTISALGRLCLSSATPVLAKHAALCLTTLFRDSKRAFVALLQPLSQGIQEAASGGAAQFSPYVAGMVKAVQVIVRETDCDVDASTFIDNISRVLMLAIREPGTGDGAHAKNGRGAQLSNPKSRYHVIVDCCAKALSAFIRREAANGHTRAPLVRDTAKTFFTAFAEIKVLGSSTLGGTLKRMALYKQMIKLLKYPDLVLADELRLCMYVSAEHNAFSRSEIQKRISSIIQRDRCDMRLFSLLCLTAMAEESRAGFSALKQQAQLACDRLRQLQQQNQSLTLSDSRALFIFPEYSIPFTVMAQAHHGFYTAEEQCDFIGFQRVWHLLFEELTRRGLHCVSFVQDLLRKLRAHDDQLAPESERTRVICDLATKVLTACLAQRSVGLEALKPYPGTVLLPPYFIRPVDAARHPQDRVYLKQTVAVSALVPFRAPTRARPDEGAAVGDSDEDEGRRDDEDDDELVAPADVDTSRFDEVFTATPSRAAPPAAAAGKRQARSKSHRAETPPPPTTTAGDDDAENVAPANARSPGNSRNKGRAGGRPATQSDAVPTPNAKESADAKLEGVIARFCSGKSSADIKRLSWRDLKKAVVTALNVEMTDELKARALALVNREMETIAARNE